MITIKRLIGRGGLLATAFVFGAAVVVPALLPNGKVGATGQFTSRSLSLSSSNDGGTAKGAAGTGTNGAAAQHTFTFSNATATTVGSYLFEYCTTPLLDTACTAPAGMDASTAVIAGSPAESGFAATMPSLDTTTVSTSSGVAGSKFQVNAGAEACSGGTGRANCILIKRTTPVAEVVGADTVSFSGVKNPNNTVTSFYVRIYSFSDSGYTNANIVDEAAVAAAITNTVDITAKVQEKLNFSVATTNTPTSASCPAETGGGALTLGVGGILDATTPSTADSYFRLSTNTANGTSVYYSGDTLKSAQGYSIAPLTSSSSSAIGTEQFGLGFDQGDGIHSFAGGSTGLTAFTNYTVSASGALPGTAKFNYTNNALTVPVKIASSTGAVTCDTGSVRYLANIAPTTKAGVYTTSIAYIATGIF